MRHHGAGQPAGPDEQDDREQEHDREVAEAGGGVVVRVLLRQPDRHRGVGRALDRTEAADDDDDEGEDQQRGPAVWIDAAEVDA